MGVREFANRQNLLNMTKVICRQSFTLYRISFILESLLLFVKHFLYKIFSYLEIWEMYYCIMSSIDTSIFENLPYNVYTMCLLVQNNGNLNLWNMHENQYVKYVRSQQQRYWVSNNKWFEKHLKYYREKIVTCQREQ